MLSLEHPSGPSCPSNTNSSAVLSTEQEKKPSAEKAAAADSCSQEAADLVKPVTPKFSIRDYAFASRSKSIKTGWPFHPQSLHLCLKLGVKDLLPPFEPPDLVRAKFLSTTVELEQSITCSKADEHLNLLKGKNDDSCNDETSNIKCLDQSRYPLLEEGKSSIDQGQFDESNDSEEVAPAVLQLNNSAIEPSKELEVAVRTSLPQDFNLSREQTEKKCRLVVKLSSLTDNRRAEEPVSNSSTVSDPMASKTCPVCKVFASTSNTTLNAHMDQCLSVESNGGPVENVMTKPKIKPRKKKLMVDIYKTALPFTLQDLDRRNGTNWAVELGVATVNNEVCIENRSPEILPSDRRDDEREGAVYVDSNGIKIRILSKSNDAPLMLRDHSNLRKKLKNEAKKSILISKKNFNSKHSKNKKLQIHGKKYHKVNLLNTLCQVRQHMEDGNDEDCYQNDESASAMSKAKEDTIYNGTETIRQWVCSKRSGLAKKLSRKSTYKTLQNLVSGERKLTRSSKPRMEDSNVLEDHMHTFSRSPEGVCSSPNSNMAHDMDDESEDFPSPLASISKWSSKAVSSHGVMLKLSKSPGASLVKKVREIGTCQTNKSDGANMVTSSNPKKDLRVGIVSSSLLRLRDDLTEQPSTSKKFRKHRSPPRIGKREVPSGFTGAAHHFVEDQDAIIRHVNKKLRTTKKTFSRNFTRFGQEDGSDDALACGNYVPLSGQEEKDKAVDLEDGMMASLPVDPPTNEPGTESGDDILTSRSLPNNCSTELNTDDPVNDKLAHGAVWAEGCEDTAMQISSNQQLMDHIRVISNVASEDVRVRQADPAFTSNGFIGGEAPQDNSSITSNNDHGSGFDPESSESPVSTASTVPLPTVKEPQIKESESAPSAASIRSTEEGNGRSLYHEKEVTLPSKEYKQLSDDPLFCCSCRGSLSSEPQPLGQSMAHRTVSTLKGKQLPQLQIGPRASSSFSSYQRTNTKVNPTILESRGPSLNTKAPTQSAMNVPAYISECSTPSWQTQLPSPSNPILRLMGKNLMVMNNVDTGYPQAPNSDYILRENYMAPLGFAPYASKSVNSQYHLNSTAFINRAPPMVHHNVPQPTVQAGCFTGPPLQNAPMPQSHLHSQHKPYRNIVPMVHPAYMMKDVIVINDSPENRSEPNVSLLLPAAASPSNISMSTSMAPRPFFCHPSPSQILPRHAPIGSTPVFTNLGPMVNVTPANQGSTPEVANPFVVNPFLVQSPTGYLSSSMYYPQNFR